MKKLLLVFTLLSSSFVIIAQTYNASNSLSRVALVYTGPLEEWESASWDWDHSSYNVAGDASKMNISKVIITYTNGTKVTIPKNKLRFN